MAFQNLDTGVLDVFSAITGSSLEIPKGFWKPGTGAIYNAYLGKTSILGFGQASVSFGMNPDSPLAMYGAPGNVNLHNKSITTYIGDHLVVGRSSVTGIEFRTSVTSAEIYGAAILLDGSYVDIISTNTVISGANVKIGAPNLTINGDSWFGYIKPKLEIAGKGFDIPHPTKPDTHRLRYICLEVLKLELT